MLPERRPRPKVVHEDGQVHVSRQASPSRPRHRAREHQFVHEVGDVVDLEDNAYVAERRPDGV